MGREPWIANAILALDEIDVNVCINELAITIDDVFPLRDIVAGSSDSLLP